MCFSPFFQGYVELPQSKSHILLTLAVLESVNLSSFFPTHAKSFPPFPDSFFSPFSVCPHQYFRCNGQNSDMNHLDTNASQRGIGARPASAWQVNKQPLTRLEADRISMCRQVPELPVPPSRAAELLLNGDINQKSAPLSRY